MDTKGWYPIHRAAVQQSVQVLEMVLYGELEYKVHCCSFQLLYISINKNKKKTFNYILDTISQVTWTIFASPVEIFPNKAKDLTFLIHIRFISDLRSETDLRISESI